MMERHRQVPLDDSDTSSEIAERSEPYQDHKQPLQGRRLFGYPIPVFFILGNEFCERFSFYGLKAVLWLYLNEFLLFDEKGSTSIYHGFVFFSYGFPILGAILADSYFGKFKTIWMLSIVYCIGGLILSLTAIPGATGTPPHWWGMVLGLFFIAVGTGGIKPCVSSFGGDQIPMHEQHLLTSFFSFFYLSINVGSFISTFLTPLLRVNVGYWCAFGTPAILLLSATAIFISGRKFYVISKPENNVLGNFFKTLKDGMVMLVTQRKQKVEHWLDRCQSRHGHVMVSEVKSVLRICTVLIPLPMFWALFDQHSSTWVEQARDLDRKIGSWEIQPDQMPTLNPMMIMILIPLFDRVIYPQLRKRNIPHPPLVRIFAGMIITSIAFAIAGTVALFQSGGRVHVIWQVPQFLILTVGEILVSVSGLEFAYAEAPKSMKSVVTAVWLLTVSAGNALVAVIAEGVTLNAAGKFFLYCGMMGISTLIFGFLARRFKKVQLEENSQDEFKLIETQSQVSDRDVDQ